MPPTEINDEGAKGWFPDLSWKTLLMLAGLSTLTGGGASLGVVASKAVAAAPNNSISQDQADVRYVTKDAAEIGKKQLDGQLEAIDKKALSREVYEAYHSNDVERMQRMEKTLDLILQNSRPVSGQVSAR